MHVSYLHEKHMIITLLVQPEPERWYDASGIGAAFPPAATQHPSLQTLLLCLNLSWSESFN